MCRHTENSLCFKNEKKNALVERALALRQLIKKKKSCRLPPLDVLNIIQS